MGLENYDDLKAEIASYIARSDVTAVSTIVDSFIDLAEAHINRKLRVRRMQDAAVILTVAGTETVSLPTDFLERIALDIGGCDLDMTSINGVKTNETGQPRYAALKHSDGVDKLRLKPVPDAEYTIGLTYYAKIPSLSSESATNWLLTYYPEIYLNACLYYAFKRYRSALAGEYKTLFEADIDILNVEDERSTGGALKIHLSGATP